MRECENSHADPKSADVKEKLVNAGGKGASAPRFACAISSNALVV